MDSRKIKAKSRPGKVLQKLLLPYASHFLEADKIGHSHLKRWFSVKNQAAVETSTSKSQVVEENRKKREWKTEGSGENRRKRLFPRDFTAVRKRRAIWSLTQ